MLFQSRAIDEHSDVLSVMNLRIYLIHATVNSALWWFFTSSAKRRNFFNFIPIKEIHSRSCWRAVKVKGTFSKGWILSTGSRRGFLLFLFSMADWASAIAHLSMGWGNVFWTRSCPTQRALRQPQPPERLNKTQHSKLLPLQDGQLSSSSGFATRFPNCSLLTQLGFCLFSDPQQPSLPWAPRIPSNLLKSLIFSRAARRSQSPLPVEGSWIWMVFRIPSNPDYSGILWDQESKI